MSDEMDFDMEVVKNENAFASSTAEAEEKEDSESRSGVSRDADTSSADGRWSSGSEEPRETDSGESLAGSLRQHADSPVPGWDVVRLGDVLKLEYGDNLPERDREDGSVPVYGSNGKVDTHSEPAVSAPGLVLGRKGSIGEIVLSESPFWPIDTTYYITRKETSLNLRYLQNLLQGLQLESLNAASAIPGLNRNDVYNLRVIVPPLPEQRKIASVLCAVDQAIQKTEAIIEQAQRVKQGMMQDLLSRGIDQTGQVRDRNGEYKQSPCGPIPTHWETVSIQEAAQVQVGYAFSSDDFVDSGVPVVRMSDLQQGRLDLSEARRVPADLAKSKQDYALRPGNVLVGMSGSIEKYAVVRDEDLPCLLNQRVGRFITDQDILREGFIKYLVDTKNYLDQIDRMASGAAQRNVSKFQIGQVKIPLPPVSEQDRIVDRLSTIDEQIDNNRQLKRSFGRVKKALMQDLLTGEVRTAEKAIEVLDEVKAHG